MTAAEALVQQCQDTFIVRVCTNATAAYRMLPHWPALNFDYTRYPLWRYAYEHIYISRFLLLVEVFSNLVCLACRYIITTS
jgi:hypothetical protein